MSRKNEYQKRYTVLLTLSLLIHVCGYLAFLYLLQPKYQSRPETPTSVTVSLTAPVEVAEPEPEQQAEKEEQETSEATEPEVPAQMDNSDRIASDNQEDPTATEVVAGGAPEEKPAEAKEGGARSEGDTSPEVAKAADLDPRPDNEKNKVELTELEIAQSKEIEAGAREVLDSVNGTNKAPITQTEAQTAALAAAESSERERTETQELSSVIDEIFGNQGSTEQGEDEVIELELPSEFHNQFGNMELLNDEALAKADVPQPFSENKSKELELANKYLARMNRQVRSVWKNPYRGGEMYRGVIKIELNVKGFLLDAFVYRASGLNTLDQSVLDAIYAVKRFDVPENEIIASRYYTHMSFHYSSLQTKTELMPFEQKRIAKEDS